MCGTPGQLRLAVTAALPPTRAQAASTLTGAPRTASFPSPGSKRVGDKEQAVALPPPGLRVSLSWGSALWAAPPARLSCELRGCLGPSGPFPAAHTHVVCPGDPFLLPAASSPGSHLADFLGPLLSSLPVLVPMAWWAGMDGGKTFSPGAVASSNSLCPVGWSPSPPTVLHSFLPAHTNTGRPGCHRAGLYGDPTPASDVAS